MSFSRKKSSFIYAAIGTLLILFGTLTYGLQAFAHGYVDEAKSRAVLCSEGVNKDCGGVEYEPQSVEGPGDYPEAGVPDGQIASGGGVFPKLDEQSEDRWAKVPMSSGAFTFHWTLTAAHATANWDYYITKEGWDPNSPLERDDFELFCTYDDGGKRPDFSVSHDCVIPERDGYHVILAYWEVADTANAFYQVIDANFDGEFVPPVDGGDDGDDGDNGDNGDGNGEDNGSGNGNDDVATWDSSQVYLGGDTVKYDGNIYKAKWWTQGDVPGENAVWELVSEGEDNGNGEDEDNDNGDENGEDNGSSEDADAWDSSKVYLKGDIVEYEGTLYEAQWWTQGDNPAEAGEWGAWKAL